MLLRLNAETTLVSDPSDPNTLPVGEFVKAVCPDVHVTVSRKHKITGLCTKPRPGGGRACLYAPLEGLYALLKSAPKRQVIAAFRGATLAMLRQAADSDLMCTLAGLCANAAAVVPAAESVVEAHELTGTGEIAEAREQDELPGIEITREVADGVDVPMEEVERAGVKGAVEGPVSKALQSFEAASVHHIELVCNAGYVRMYRCNGFNAFSRTNIVQTATGYAKENATKTFNNLDHTMFDKSKEFMVLDPRTNKQVPCLRFHHAIELYMVLPGRFAAKIRMQVVRSFVESTAKLIPNTEAEAMLKGLAQNALAFEAAMEGRIAPQTQPQIDPELAEEQRLCDLSVSRAVFKRKRIETDHEVAMIEQQRNTAVEVQRMQDMAHGNAAAIRITADAYAAVTPTLNGYADAMQRIIDLHARMPAVPQQALPQPLPPPAPVAEPVETFLTVREVAASLDPRWGNDKMLLKTAGKNAAALFMQRHSGPNTRFKREGSYDVLAYPVSDRDLLEAAVRAAATPPRARTTRAALDPNQRMIPSMFPHMIVISTVQPNRLSFPEDDPSVMFEDGTAMNA